MKPNIVRLLTILTIISVLLSACAQPQKSTLNVPLGWLNNDEFVALQVAERNGYFKNQGIERVNLISGGGSTGFDPVVAIQGFDDSTRIGVNAALSEVIKAVAKGAKVTAVAALQQMEPSGFATLTDSGRQKLGLPLRGNQAKGPCDFDGKVVSMQDDGMWYVDILGGLCEKKPLKSGVNFTRIPAGWTPDCLNSKGQDACDFYCCWVTNQVFVLETKWGLKKGVDWEMFLTSQYLPFRYADVVIAQNDYLAKHPEVVKSFVKATVEGMQYAIDHPDEAAKIAASIEGIELAHAKWRIPIQNELAVSDDTQAYGLGWMNPEMVQKMCDILYERGQTERRVLASEVVNNSFLPGK